MVATKLEFSINKKITLKATTQKIPPSSTVINIEPKIVS